MATFVVLAQLTPEGNKRIAADPQRLSAVNDDVERLGGRVLRQYGVLGEYDLVTFVDVADNITAASIATQISSLGTVKLELFPAIGFDRFVELLNIRSYRTEPHTWQTQPWARLLRRVSRYWVMTRHVNRLCKPLTVEGRELLRDVKGPAIIIANHTSHIDTLALLTALPGHLREKSAVAAAADRFYRTSMRSWWFSLFWNTYPVARGGGKVALDYTMSLLERNWSIVIFPEGGRFKPGRLQKFRHGPTIMAMEAKVPVIPVYLEGLDKLMPRGQRTPTPGPASVRFGEPVSLAGVGSIPEGTSLLERAVRELGGLPIRDAKAEPVAAGAEVGRRRD